MRNILQILGDTRGSIKSGGFKSSWEYDPKEKRLILTIKDSRLEFVKGMQREIIDYLFFIRGIKRLKRYEEKFHIFFGAYSTEFDRRGNLLTLGEYKYSLFLEKMRFAVRAWLSGRRLRPALRGGINHSYKLAKYIHTLKVLFEVSLDEEFQTIVSNPINQQLETQRREIYTLLIRTFEIIVNNFIMQYTVYKNFYEEDPIYEEKEKDLKKLKRLG
jgi:hypothetical protein